MNKYRDLFNQMVEKTYDYLKQNKIETMVLGISGGIDSTVVAFVCAEISARHNDVKFLFLSLPSSTNQTEENRIAELIIKNMEHDAFDNLTIPIQDCYDNIVKTIDSSEQADKISLGNVKARLRMMTLYHYAYRFKGVVMDTDNLTEHYTGFFTIHGDVGDLSPMGGSLWKTDVYGVANWLLNEARNTETRQLSYFTGASDYEMLIYQDILQSSIKLAPSDGNCGGTDMDQIAPGFTYNEVDGFLKKYIEYKKFIKNNDICTIKRENDGYIICFNDGHTEYISNRMIRMTGTSEMFSLLVFDKEKVADEFFRGHMETINNLIDRVNRTEFKRKKQPVRIYLD